MSTLWIELSRLQRFYALHEKWALEVAASQHNSGPHLIYLLHWDSSGFEKLKQGQGQLCFLIESFNHGFTIRSHPIFLFFLCSMYIMQAKHSIILICCIMQFTGSHFFVKQKHGKSSFTWNWVEVKDCNFPSQWWRYFPLRLKQILISKFLVWRIFSG